MEHKISKLNFGLTLKGQNDAKNNFITVIQFHGVRKIGL